MLRHPQPLNAGANAACASDLHYSLVHPPNSAAAAPLEQAAGSSCVELIIVRVLAHTMARRRNSVKIPGAGRPVHYAILRYCTPPRSPIYCISGAASMGAKFCLTRHLSNEPLCIPHHAECPLMLRALLSLTSYPDQHQRCFHFRVLEMILDLPNSASVTAVSAAAVTYVFLWMLLRLTQNAKEPPAVLTTLPFVSPILGMVRYS